MAWGCASPRSLVGHISQTTDLPPVASSQAPHAVPIVQIKLPWSNTFLIKSSRPILIDAGMRDDATEMERELDFEGYRPSDIALVILTHAHSDHAGLARYFQKLGAKVVMGRGDLHMASAGRHDPLKPHSFVGQLVSWSLPDDYPPFTPDLIVDDRLSLQAWGLDADVLSMPGHTPGSLVVVTADHQAFVGDMILGGSLGGMFNPTQPAEHYFEADPELNHQNIKKLLGMGIEKFYLGHGGPVDANAVSTYFGFSLVNHLGCHDRHDRKDGTL